MTRNRLADETGPHLPQHRDNPARRQARSPQTLALTAREGKPILLPVGLAACHCWHGLAHEPSARPARDRGPGGDAFPARVCNGRTRPLPIRDPETQPARLAT